MWPVRKMYLKGVMRARMTLMTKLNSMIIGVSKPSTVWTAATRLLSSGTTPEMPKAALNMVLKLASAPQITLEPALSTRKPRMVLSVPVMTVDGLLRIATRPIRATMPMTMVGVLRNSTKKLTMIFPPC